MSPGNAEMDLSVLGDCCVVCRCQAEVGVGSTPTGMNSVVYHR